MLGHTRPKTYFLSPIRNVFAEPHPCSSISTKDLRWFLEFIFKPASPASRFLFAHSHMPYSEAVKSGADPLLWGLRIYQTGRVEMFMDEDQERFFKDDMDNSVVKE
jgi:hypothetical protein